MCAFVAKFIGRSEMKFVDIEEIWKKYPNKYVAIVAAAKEARKITEIRKPPSPPKSADTPVTDETAVPEPLPIEPPAPKKRGRKPKKLAVETTIFPIRDSTEKTEVAKPAIKMNPTVDPFPVEMRGTIKWRGDIAEKTEPNAYVEALKKILE